MALHCLPVVHSRSPHCYLIRVGRGGYNRSDQIRGRGEVITSVRILATCALSPPSRAAAPRQEPRTTPGPLPQLGLLFLGDLLVADSQPAQRAPGPLPQLGLLFLGDLLIADSQRGSRRGLAGGSTIAAYY